MNFKKVLKGDSYRKKSLFHYIEINTLEVRNLEMLFKAMSWKNKPILDETYLFDFEYLEDLNDRRIKDAEVICSACINSDPKIILEIGTSKGRMTSLIAKNAEDSTVFTVNIPPEEILKGGKYTTHAIDKEEIGIIYKEKKLNNITQIFANTANWEPDFGPIDVAFIDGSHDSSFVYNDTIKVLKNCRKGSIIMWHDFNPHLRSVYPWISDVCKGINRLYKERYLKGKILHLQDSWVGLYKVE